MTKRYLRALAWLVFASLMARPNVADAASSTGARDQEIRELRERLERLEKEARDEKALESARIAKIEEHQSSQPRWTFKNLRPTLSSPDDAFEIALRGRFQVDFASFEQEDGNMGAGYGCGAGALCDLGSGAIVRRARFGLEGKFFKDFIYELRFEFGGTDAESSGSVNIARVGYTGIPNLRVHAGAIQPIFTLSSSTSSADLNTIERPSVIAALLDPFGGDSARRGIEATFMKQGILYPGDNFVLSAAFTGQRVGTPHSGNPDDEGTQLLGRAAYRAYADEDANVQFGMSASKILSLSGTAPGDARNLRFSDRPENRVQGNRFVDTGTIASDGGSVVGFEAAANFKNLFLAGEYYAFGADRSTPLLPDPEFEGWYIEGTWILTGERKAYKAAATNNNIGVWTSPVPKQPFAWNGGIGAWELTARYSVLDLDFRESLPVALGGVAGGRQAIANAGVNWFPNTNLKLVAEYAIVEVDRHSAPGTLDSALDAEFEIVQGRLQFSF